ncbi:MAG TPA: ferrous iron transport protein B [Acholeplasmataceae bacterium]|jgi:ferrous iron transport protein B|nr:ferrous iron transport protein B [Acholeplasmataceae bacterium]HQC30941.1 ferrous iron transport protein B [Acholeplasmataceae bacterium]
MIALIGNQNSGKTTLFNLLTGTQQKVGNWPGVTLEKKVGTIKSTNHEIVDLPGIYSLSSYSSEEMISRDFLLNENPSLIINVLDITQLERSLYLTLRLIDLKIPMIITLNMKDLADKKGIIIDLEKINAILKYPVLEISALKKTGVNELVDIIETAKAQTPVDIKYFSDDIETAITKISSQIDHRSNRFIASKLLEDDNLIKEFETEETKNIRESLINQNNYQMDEEIAHQRYGFIEKMKKEIVSYNEKFYKETITRKIDKIVLNRWLAIPIFILIMAGIYYLSAGVVGGFTVGLMEGLFESLSEVTETWLESVGASPWAVSLVVNGVIAGVGAVLGFVPQLAILFLLISLLEASGYMSRIAFTLDQVFRKVGLSGKSIIPFILGIGCSVPAIMATKTIDDEQEKEMTIYLAPFVPCNAKLPIIALFAGYFFPNNRGLITIAFYFMSIVVIGLLAFILKKLAFKKTSTGYISELPTYKLPSARYVTRDVLGKIWSFIKRAGTVILLSSIIIWFLASFTWSFRYTTDPSDSILRTFGDILAPLFYPMLGTLNWGASVSAIQGLVAKENVVSTMGIIANLTANAVESLGSNPSPEALRALFGSEANSLFSTFTGLSAFSFMTFNLFSAPCFGAIGAMRDAFGSRKKMWLAVLLQTGFAWLLASAIFGIGSLIGVIVS